MLRRPSGGSDGERGPDTQSATACSSPSTVWVPVVRIEPLQSPFPCVPSPLTTFPALEGLRPPRLSPHLKDGFLWTVDFWDHLVYGATLLLSGAHFPAFQNKQHSCPKRRMSASGAAACAAWWFLQEKQPAFLLKFHFPFRTKNHWRLITDTQTLFQAGAASALARPWGWCPSHSSATCECMNCSAWLCLGSCLYPGAATP